MADRESSESIVTKNASLDDSTAVSLRWLGWLLVDTSGVKTFQKRFECHTNGGVRLWIDGESVIDDDHNGERDVLTKTPLTLTGNPNHCNAMSLILSTRSFQII